MGLAFDVYEVMRDEKSESPAHPKTGRAFKWGRRFQIIEPIVSPSLPLLNKPLRTSYIS